MSSESGFIISTIPRGVSGVAKPPFGPPDSSSWLITMDPKCETCMGPPDLPMCHFMLHVDKKNPHIHVLLFWALVICSIQNYIIELKIYFATITHSKDGSRYWGLFAHFFMLLLACLGQKGLTMRRYGSFLKVRESPLCPSNSKDRSLYWQKSAHLDRQISWDFIS